MAECKVVVVGLDSITPVMIDRFVEEGRMPNLKRLRERGWSSEITPTMPPTTPAGWTTIATGAWPSTHGIEGFAVHAEGEPLDQKNHACTAARIKAETIWQAAERAGKRTVLLKYPMSWPPLGGDKVVQVDGAGGWGGLKCVFDLAHSACWDTEERAAEGEQGVIGDWMTRDQDNLDEESVRPLPVSEPGNWLHLPDDVQPLWETQLRLQTKGGCEAVAVYVLAVACGEERRLLLATARDASVGQWLNGRGWSEWMRITFQTVDGARSGHLRVKVMEFDAEEKRLRLYQTQVHQEDGYTRPAGLANELLEAAGPFVEWTESYDRLQGWIDDETQLEIYEQHVEWMSRASAYLLRNQQWDLFMTQVHFLDMAYHIYWGAVQPEHPEYDPERAPVYWELLGKAHELADRFLGAVLQEVDDDTQVVVLGDHGHDAYHSNFLANHLLIKEGLLAVQRDPRTGEARIDWKRTKVYANSYRVYFNVAGRDPDGIVTSTEYRELQERVIRLFEDVRDPRTGAAPIRVAIRREDAQSLGLYGGSMGDVVIAMAPGYQTRSTIALPDDAWRGRRLQRERVSLFKQTRLFRDFTGEHDTSLPMTRSIRTLLYMAGPGVREGSATVPVRMVDVAPTLCRSLGIPYPQQCEGNPLWQPFEGEG